MQGRRKEFEVDSETGKAIAYLDNASIVNALTVLADPDNADPYKLLDLETFCEAFLLYDHVRTLTGHSFMSAVGPGFGHAGGYQETTDSPSYETPVDFSDTAWVELPKTKKSFKQTLRRVSSGEGRIPELYAALIELDLLRPVVVSAGSVHYHLEHLDVFDAVAQALDIDRIVQTASEIFSDEIPWDNVAFGEQTWQSDSYPAYFFPRPPAEQKDRSEDDGDFYWELNNNRRTNWVDTFVAQTFFYVIQASLHRRPYLCSAIRLPVVSATIDQLNGRFASFAQGSLNALDREERRKLVAVTDFLGAGAVKSLRLPALAYVLRQSDGRTDLLRTLFRLRDRKQVRSFRQWCRESDRAWRDQDVDGMYRSVQELTGAVEALARSASLEPIPSTLVRVPDPLAMVDGADDSGQSLGERVLRAAYNPSLVFLEDFSSYAPVAGAQRAVIEQLIERELTDEDVATYQQIYETRQDLYSDGRLANEQPAVRVEKLEVNMGDHFENVRNSIIATRGSIARGIVSVRENGSEEIANALSELEALVAGLSSEDLPEEKRGEAFELVQGMTDEAAKQEPSRTTMRALGMSLLGILGAVEPIAAAAKTAIDALTALFG
jgi:hypothetical protein